MSVDVERYQDPRVVRRLILRSRTIAVVGLSSIVLRPSYVVAFYLQRHGYRIIPVNPREEQVLGEVSHPSLSAVGEHVDVVDVFRAPEAVPEIAREAAAGLLGRATAPVNPSAIKAAIVRREPDFDERDHGFSSFSRLLEAMEKDGLLRMEQGAKGQWYVVPA